MSAGSNSNRNQKNSLAQRARRSAGRVNDHAIGEGELFHERGPVPGAFGPKGSDPEAVFKEHDPDIDVTPRPNGSSAD